MEESQVQDKPALDAAEIKTAIQALAQAIADRHDDLAEVILAGVPTRGVEVARRLQKAIACEHEDVPDLGTLDISMHRDDLATRTRMTTMEPTRLPLVLDGRTVIIVDDVVFTGRSCRAAMDAIQSFGRPARIEYAVLIDRGHRELPICPNYIGRRLQTQPDQKIRVRFENLDGVPDSVRVVNP